ncbi:MAG: hypothetical protein LBG62_01075 [Candidatus Methanoplasma sp.]|nr:hypothetical protein [Candidatus Methanoplasma sp.]
MDGKECVTVRVEQQRFLVNLDGRFYVRSGSTTNMADGHELVDLILESRGISWTDLPAKNVGLSDLSREAVEYMVSKGIKCGRLFSGASVDDLPGLLRHFDLYVDGELTTAAALLFHPEPHRVCPEARIVIGYFGDGIRLLMEDYIECPCILQPESAVNKLFDRYIPGVFEIQGVNRTLVFRYSEDAIREALTNCVIHSDYSHGLPIKVRVCSDRLEITNKGRLPRGWDVDSLTKKHESLPKNKRMADVFHDAGLIERWGAGIGIIVEGCKKIGAPAPKFEMLHDDTIMLTIYAARLRSDGESVAGRKPAPDFVPDDRQRRLVSIMAEKGPMGMREIAAEFPEINRDSVRRYVLAPLLKNAWVAPADDRPPRSKNRMYRVN